MMPQARPPLFLYERTGRWAASLRRHGLVERLQLIETRSLAELDEELALWRGGLVGLELSEDSAGRIVEWLARHELKCGSAIALVFADRKLAGYEMLCRELGAVHFVVSQLEVIELGPFFDRYLSGAASGTLDDPATSLEDRVYAAFREVIRFIR
jgi:hypothetical protein